MTILVTHFSRTISKLQRIEHELNETSADLRQKSNIEMKVCLSQIFTVNNSHCSLEC